MSGESYSPSNGYQPGITDTQISEAYIWIYACCSKEVLTRFILLHVTVKIYRGGINHWYWNALFRGNDSLKLILEI